MKLYLYTYNKGNGKCYAESIDVNETEKLYRSDRCIPFLRIHTIYKSNIPIMRRGVGNEYSNYFIYLTDQKLSDAEAAHYIKQIVDKDITRRKGQIEKLLKENKELEAVCFDTMTFKERI